MPVRKNKNKWLAELMIERQRYRKQFGTEEEALSFEAELRKRKKLGESLTDLLTVEEAATFGDMVDRCYSRYWAASANESQVMSNMKILESFFGRDTFIEDITVNRIDDFIGHLESLKRAPATINQKLAHLGKILRYSVERGYLRERPKIERVKQPSNERRVFFDYETEADIMDYLGDNNPDFFDWFVFAIDTGIRPGEIQQLTKRCFRTDPVLGPVVDVQDVKDTHGTTERRTVPLTKRADSAARRQLWDSSGPFVRWTSAERRTAWAAVRENVDMDPELVPYCCRHTTATRLVQQGCNLKAIQKLMGHKTLDMTLKYVKLVPSDLLGCVKALEKPKQTA
jgi:integrase